MKIHLLFFLLLPALSFAQSKGDSKIVITVNKKDSLYNKVKQALTQNNFIVKDDGHKTVINTYPRKLEKTSNCYSIAKAEISGNTIILSGLCGNKQIEDFSKAAPPEDYKPVTYLKRSIAWKLLMDVVNEMDGQVSFAK